MKFVILLPPIKYLIFELVQCGPRLPDDVNTLLVSVFTSSPGPFSLVTGSP